MNNKYKQFLFLFIFFILIFNAVSYSQWSRVKSFTGGNVVCMANDGNTIYGCVIGFGLVKSEDDGDHWSFVNDTLGVPFDNTTELSAEGSRILIGDPNSAQFLYSIDSGASWSGVVVPVAVSDYLDDQKIYKGKIIATSYWGRIYSSSDDGVTWNVDSSGNYDHYKIEISDDRIFLTPNYLVNGNTVFTSLDTGNTWIGLGSPGTNCASFAAKGDTLAFVSPYQQLKISPDLGVTWNTVPCSPINFNTFPAVYFNNDTLYFINHDSIFNSYNLGANWNFIAYKGGLRATSIVKTGTNFLISSHNHAFVRFNTSNNTTVKKAKEIYGTNVSDIKVKGDSLMVTTGDLYYYSYDNGNTWSYSIPFDNNGYYALGPLAYDATAIYTSNYTKVLRSSDWGISWTPFDTIPQAVINMTCYNGKIFYATPHGVYRGLSQGGTINKYGSLNTNIKGVAALDNKLFAIDDDYIYSTTIGPNPQWITTIDGLSAPQNFDYVVASDTAVFIGGYGKSFYRCYPPDTTWTNTGLYQQWVTDLSCFHNDAFTASGGKGTIVLRNYTGSVWDPINFGLPDDFRPYQIAAGDTFLFTGGNFHGLYRRLRSEINVSVGVNEFNISQLGFSIYPNPSKDILYISTKNNFKPNEISLYDAAGRKVLQKEISGAASFSIKELHAGIYFYEIKDAKGNAGRGKVVRE